MSITTYPLTLHRLLIALLCTGGVAITPAIADPSGLSIMQKVDNLEDGDDLTQQITQILLDRNGNQRTRHMASFRKDYGEDTKRIIFFSQPANIRDTALLTFDYDNPDTDDDQWLYLPALKKVRRISSADRGDYFMGTDFTFEDMKQTPELKEYHWKLLSSVTIASHDCWKIEGIPVSEDIARELGYSKQVQFIRKDNDFAIQTDYWDRAGRELKRMTVVELQQIQGIWSPLKIEMVNMQSNHKTVLEFSDLHYNTELKGRLFSQRTLKRGYR